MAAATATALLVVGITLVATSFGWWQGNFFEISLPVLFMIDLPLSIAGYVLWLGGYCWLARHTSRPLLVYGLITLIFIPIVLFIDPISIHRGQFSLGRGYTIWTDALVGQTVMWSPVIFHEGIRWRMGIRRT